MKGLKYGLTMLVFFVLMASQASAETILISGSTTVKKYMKMAIHAYQLQHPEVVFNLNGGGSTAGFAQLSDVRTQIAMMSRELNTEEDEILKHEGLQQITIAQDAVTPIVSQEIYDFGVQNITPQQLAGIYRGEISNWKALGGPDRSIIVVDKNIYHGTRIVFAQYILGSSPIQRPLPSIILDSDNDILRLLEGSDQAIAYVGIGVVNSNVRKLNLKINNHIIIPSYASIRHGHYPMSRNLYILLPKDVPLYVQKFVDFILSPEGQSIVEQVGYLPNQAHS